MSNFFTEELKVATAEHCKARWSFGKPGENFRCGFCGHKFKEGDLWRAIYTNGTKGAPGNPLVCEKCNTTTDALRDQWKQRHDEFNAFRTSERFWWFNKNLDYV